MQSRFCSPGILLASFLSQEVHLPRLVFVTGERGAGKTTWCLELIRQARVSGLSPLGFVSPAVFQSGEKVGIDLVAIQTGESRRLTIRKDATGREPKEGVPAGIWKFDPSVLAWADRLLCELPASELLILDELGPLEFINGTGLVSGLALIEAHRYNLSCVVIRLSLLHAAQTKWPWAETLDVPRLG